LKICMLGAGALGSAIGGTLAAAGSEITLVDVFKPHVDAINTQGLRMRSAEGERVVRAKAAIDARDVGVVDLVIVLVKSFHTREAMQGALSLVGPGTVVMSLQNGLGHEDILADVVGKQHVIAGKTYVGGVFLSPGQVIAGVAGKETLIGELDGTITPRVQAVATEFERAGLSTVVSENIYGTMWDKLLVNVATGALSGITRLTYGQLYDEPLLAATAQAAVAEAIEVARAAGVVLTLTEPEQAWRLASAGLPPSFKTSMLQSLEKGSLTEIDFINGSVVRHGERHGVPTPVNATLVACIKGIERAMTDQQRGMAA
jgi:2-dehydropantoate 2-reductase